MHWWVNSLLKRSIRENGARWHEGAGVGGWVGRKERVVAEHLSSGGGTCDWDRLVVIVRSGDQGVLARKTR